MPISRQPKLSLVLVNYRSAVLLERALGSIRRLDKIGETCEIIVVNNDVSENKQVQALSNRFHFQVATLHENNGFGSAANIGAGKTCGDIIGFINPDAEAVTGSLEGLARFFQVHPEVGIVGGSLTSEKGFSEAWSTGKGITLFRLLLNKGFFFLGRKYWESDRPVSVGWVSGGALFIRKELFTSLSGFDERFFLYFEDMDLCIRARQEGFRTVFFPKLVFLHRGGASLGSDTKERKRMYYESQDLYFQKHRSWVEGKLVCLLRNGRTKI